MKRFILILFVGFSLMARAQQGDSFLCVDDFRILGPEHTFILPDGMRKTDNNGKPWAMVKIVAKGFDSKILNDISFYSPSSTLTVGNASLDANDGSYKIILSSGVKGKLVFKYQGTTLEYQMPMQLTKNRVYQLDLAMRSANLTIVATPADAKIYIDGQEVGMNGFASVNLMMGEHTYSVECDDYLAEKNKSIVLDKNETVTVELQPLFGYITVNTVPSGAEVFVNGARSGETPYLMKKIKRGSNNIEIRLNGYYDYAELVEINIGENKTIETELVPYGVVTSHSGGNIMVEPTLRLSQDTLFFDSEQSKDSIFITTNCLEWDFMDVPLWLSVYKRNNILFVTCLKNRVHASREGDITVYTGDITRTLHVYQDIGKTVLQSDKNRIKFEASRDSTIRIIETNVKDWKIVTSEPWISAYEAGDTLVVSCEANTLPVSRYGTVSVTAFDKKMTFDVSQKSHEAKITVPKDDIVVETGGGSMAIPVGNDAEEWACTSNDEWITVTHSGDAVLLECPSNEASDRKGSFLVSTDTKTFKINVLQKGTEEIKPTLLIDSKPDWAMIYIDGKKAGHTPLTLASDDSIHVVKLGLEERSYLFNNKIKEVHFNTGLKFLEVTASSETFGLRSGFIGMKRWGAYNHFQMRLNSWNLNTNSKKAPLYVMSLGPSYELTPWMSVYAGLGVALSNDSLRGVERALPDDIRIGAEVEAGLMFYYRMVFASIGMQINNIGLDKRKTDFSAGLGVYFNRDYDETKGYTATRRWQWWSLSFIYNPGRKGYGFMIGDIGKKSVRGYVKGIAEFQHYDITIVGDPNAKTKGVDENIDVQTKHIDEVDPGMSFGLMFNAVPGYIDLMIGGGYQAAFVDNEFLEKGVQAEIGICMNIWRIPISIMMRCCEFEKETRYLTVDFGLGFSFGDLKTVK